MEKLKFGEIDNNLDEADCLAEAEHTGRNKVVERIESEFIGGIWQR
jgi:hypothetical protein